MTAAPARRWLITGASSGIGAALVEAAVAAGDTVVACARNAAALARLEAAAPEQVTALPLDVSKLDRIGPAIAEVLGAGPLDVVVNNAGQGLFGTCEETALAEARGVFEVNLFAPWAVAQAVLPHFRARRTGLFVQMSSAAGLAAVPGMSAYSASKFALEGFSEALAAETAAFGIRVLLVEPGCVATPFIGAGTPVAARRITAYDPISVQGKAAIEDYYRGVTLSAAEVATTIMQAIDNPDHPLRLLVGDDHRPAAAAKGEQLVRLARR
ncbi:MAG TPA: SDR family NAD(P)-dependent oxidoreductase [Novosphingobium sp.]